MLEFLSLASSLNIGMLFYLPSLLAFIVSFSVTPLVIKLAPRLGILDDPKKRAHPATLHTKPIPRGGGIPVFLAVCITSLVLLPIDFRLAAVLLGGLVVVFIGFLDDRRDTSPYLRLVGQFTAAGVVVASGIGISFVTNPLGGIIDLSIPQISFFFAGEYHSIWLLSAGFGLVWIVALMNAVSWSSGVDGQLSGFAAIAALIVAIFSLNYSADITQWPSTVLAAATFGAFAGFLPWHVFPQKIMPGFGGAPFAGYMLAVLAILTTAKVGVLLLVLGIPLSDAIYSFFRRIFTGKHPFKGDKKHLHHRLLDLGWSKKRIAIFYWMTTLFLGILALNLNTQLKFYTIVGTGLFTGALILWLSSLSESSKHQDRGNG